MKRLVALAFAAGLAVSLGDGAAFAQPTQPAAAPPADPDPGAPVLPPDLIDQANLVQPPAEPPPPREPAKGASAVVGSADLPWQAGFGSQLVAAIQLHRADATSAGEKPLPLATDFTLAPVANDDGTHVDLEWKSTGRRFLVARLVGKTTEPPTVLATGATVDGKQVGTSVLSLSGAWEIATEVTAPAIDPNASKEELEKPQSFTYTDTVPLRAELTYAIITLADSDDPEATWLELGFSPPVMLGSVRPASALFDTTRWFFMVLVLAMALALYYYIRRISRSADDIFIRRIAGVDAIEEAVGRSTEMGRPVLYVTGVEEIQNMQTIASLLVLGHVAEMTAEYDTDLKVANFFPLTMVVAEEIVRQGFANAGRADAHKPENVMFISAEQFAFAAGVNGLILRDKPATNIYLGRFFAESLILAETGYVTRAIQIAGTAEITQLPFFIAACDYTIIGEELYAVSAYLSRKPSLLATLKATDLVKVGILLTVLVGSVLSASGVLNLGTWLMP
jgi:hypothetical protein